MKYLVTAEIDEVGFVIHETDSLEEAESTQNDLMKYSRTYDFKEMHKIKKGLDAYRSYKIHSTKPDISKFISQLTNGKLSIYIFDSTRNGFTFEKFVFERANAINVLNVDDYIDKENTYLDQMDVLVDCKAN